MSMVKTSPFRIQESRGYADRRGKRTRHISNNHALEQVSEFKSAATDELLN